MQSHHEEQGKLQNVILSGGPPWGFTLSGGSEFGSKLYVKKVSNDKKVVRGRLDTGDEILAVNGTECTSRASAIQMVRAAEDELQLKIYRWNSEQQQQTNDPELYQNNQVYDNMVETMSDLSNSIYSIKRGSIQMKNFNNNDKVAPSSTTVPQYNINTFFKNKPTTIKVGSKSVHNERSVDGYNERSVDEQPATCKIRVSSSKSNHRVPHVNERSVDSYNERSVDGEPVQQQPVRKTSQSLPVTPQFPQRQKVTVKMVPATASTTHYPSNSGKNTSKGVSHSRDGLDQTDVVEHESVQKVSKARAMFESMSSSNVNLDKSPSVARPNLKSWNSGGSLLDDKNDDGKNWDQQLQRQPLELKPNEVPVHKHSRSLPIEMAGKEFEKAMAAYRQHATATSETATNVDRPRSAFYHDSTGQKHQQQDPAPPHRYSQSDILRNYRVKSAHFEQLDSYSSEENLRNVHDPSKRASCDAVLDTAPAGGKNDSANELRQAASRYHQELMKNYPKFRHSISGKDLHAQKFNRKGSVPEDAFSRGELLRATIATASPTRNISRPLSDCVEVNSFKDVLAKSNENSMMSRLLQGQSQATMMKIEEEAARNRIDSNSEAPLIRSNSMGRYNPPMRRSSTEPAPRNLDSSSNVNVQSGTDERNVGTPPEMKSICIQTEPGPDDETNVHQPRGMSDVQTSTETLARRYSKSNENNKLPLTNKRTSLTRDACVDQSTDAPGNTSFQSEPPLTRNRSFVDDFEPAQFADVETNELVTAELQTQKQDNTHKPVQSMVSRDQEPPMNIVHSMERMDIVHTKNLSTDSAVYVMHESPGKPMSGERTDSMSELTSINVANFERGQQQLQQQLQQQHQQRHYQTNDPELPRSHSEDFMQDQHESNVEKADKPQRTINRKKKESGAVNSRNNSCVSTDSTTSTGTVDSGIVVRSDLSPRTSPISSGQYYGSKDLSTSRETLDCDVNELDDDPHATSTPERHSEHSFNRQLMRDDSVGSPVNDTVNSRLDSMESPGPGMDDLDSEKSKLIESMREKINELRDQEQEIADEIKGNEELGKKVLGMVETKATQSEFSKYELFIGELNKIVALLLSLTQRLHRYEMMLQDLDMSNESDKLKKDSLISKIDKLKSQHEEACYLRDVNDKRGDNVAIFLEKYCTEEEFADFQYYVDMKSQLALMQSEIREKVKLGEERLKALEQTGADWGIS